MRYSVWNVGTSAFDYFEDGRPQQKLNAPKPTHLRQRTLGSTVAQASWPLPADAQYIGSGENAIGMVAARASGALGDTTDNTSLVKAGLLIASAVLLWRYVVRPSRRRYA